MQQHLAACFTLCRCLQILTVWQSSMAVVSTFPHPPDKLTDTVEALAQHNGQPSAASFQTANAGSTADTWATLDNHVFKAKFLNQLVPANAAVAG